LYKRRQIKAIASSQRLLIHYHSAIIMFLPGQAVELLQLCCWLLLPEQSATPPHGGGLLHAHCLALLLPPPQATEHDVQLLHEPHPPATDNDNKNFWDITGRCVE